MGEELRAGPADGQGANKYFAESTRAGRENPLTRIRDAYTPASPQETEANEADRLMVKHFLDTLAEVALSVASRIVAVKPKPPFRPIFQVATTREGSGVDIINEPPEVTPEARMCFWWRQARESNSP